MESTGKDDLSHVTVEDCQVPTTTELEDKQSGESSKQSRVWADSIDTSSEVGSEKSQEKPKKTQTKTRVKIKVGPTVYCSFVK